jgi:hypothetical protein
MLTRVASQEWLALKITYNISQHPKKLPVVLTLLRFLLPLPISLPCFLNTSSLGERYFIPSGLLMLLAREVSSLERRRVWHIKLWWSTRVRRGISRSQILNWRGNYPHQSFQLCQNKCIRWWSRPQFQNRCDGSWSWQLDCSQRQRNRWTSKEGLLGDCSNSSWCPNSGITLRLQG